MYYLREGQIHGILLWNVWDQVKTARSLIAAKAVVYLQELHGQIGDW